MKKYLNCLLIVSLFMTTALAFNFPAVKVSADTQTMTISQLVDLLITVGVIAPDKVVAARAIFATSSLPYLQVLSPNGGESWMIDSDVPYTITWGSSNAVPVIISFVSSSGAVCKLTPSPITSHNGENSFNVLLKTASCYNSTATVSTSTPLTDVPYKVRVSYTDPSGATVKDDSNTYFVITPIPVPSIRVTYPNGAEKLVSGNYYDVKYTLTNTAERGLKISFLDYQGNRVYSESVFGSKGVYHLKIPTSLNAGAYKIKLEMTATDNTLITDTSDNFFWISDMP